jgi:hypothetical protein
LALVKSSSVLVASRLVERQGLLGESQCHVVWADAFHQGKRLAVGGRWSQQDAVTWQKLQDFETRVVDAVIKNLPGEQ